MTGGILGWIGGLRSKVLNDNIYLQYLLYWFFFIARCPMFRTGDLLLLAHLCSAHAYLTAYHKRIQSKLLWLVTSGQGEVGVGGKEAFYFMPFCTT